MIYGEHKKHSLKGIEHVRTVHGVFDMFSLSYHGKADSLIVWTWRADEDDKGLYFADEDVYEIIRSGYSNGDRLPQPKDESVSRLSSALPESILGKYFRFPRSIVCELF